MPPRAIASKVASTIASAAVDPVRSWWRSRNSPSIAGGNFGARPNPPLTRSKSRANASTTRSSAAASRRRRRQRGRHALGQRGADPAGRLGDGIPLITPGVPDRGEHLGEGRHAVRRGRREVGTRVERHPVRGEETGHGPSALPGERLGRGHVHGVDPRVLLPVHLDRHEVLVHQGCDDRIFERLVGHDVAPVTGLRIRSTAGLAYHGASPRRTAACPQGHQSTGLSLCCNRYVLVEVPRRFMSTILLPGGP